MDGFIEKQVARTNRNFLINNILLLVLVGGILAASMRFITNMFQGPTKVAKSALLGVTDPTSISNYYVTVVADEVKDTGVVHITTTTRNGVKESEKTDGYYYAAFLDDKYLLVERDTQDESSTITGSLETLSSDEKIKIIEDIEKEFPDLKGQFLPYKINAAPFSGPGHYLIVGVLALLIALGLFNIARWVMRTSNKSNHPIMKQLAKLGDPELLTQNINAEIPADTKGPMATSPHWIVSMTRLGAAFRKTEDIIWAHIIRTQHRTYGVPTAKTFALKIFDRDGKTQIVNFGRKEDQATQFQELLKANVPWAIVGYSDELEKTWRKNRAEVVATVDARRAAARQASA